MRKLGLIVAALIGLAAVPVQAQTGCVFTEFLPAAGTDDGFTFDSDAVFPPPGPASPNDNAPYTLTGNGLGGTYEFGVSMIRWDTSALTGRLVLSAQLRETLSDDFGPYTDTDGCSYVGEWYVHDGSIAASDYTTTISSTAFSPSGACGTDCLMANLPSTAAAQYTLDMDAAAANVSTTGFTGIRTFLDCGGAPTGNNFLATSAFDDGVLEPSVLRVEHCDLAPPAPLCSAGNADLLTDAAQLIDHACLPPVKGPTTGRCTLSMTQGVVIFQCHGQARQVVEVEAWP